MEYEVMIYAENYDHAPKHVMKSKSPFMAVAIGQAIDIAGHSPAIIQQIHHVFIPPQRSGSGPVHQIKILI